ncbi:ATP-binding protein [Streptomyces sp. NPDC006992]|uniref:ATP-binding protein n=1 Tax=Streptomyces sp. NPDC006992 TaxID=3155601 RepID=UPI00341130D0
MPHSTTWARQAGHPGYSRTLSRALSSAATARRLTYTALSCWGLDELADDAALVVSELVANAVQHARRESIRVVVERTGVRSVRVAVADFSRARPVAREVGEGDEGGRGLALVGELAVGWGVDERRWGKVVWAELEAGE